MITIAISKGSGSPSYANYATWLHAVDPSIRIVDCQPLSVEEAVAALDACDGLILTGGPDVAPERYEQPDVRPLCQTIDDERDAKEFALVERARDLRLPTLGICRGAQVLNVAYGGTLVADIPSQRPSQEQHGSIDSVDATHDLHVESGSILKYICGVMDSTVNSSHHQAVDHIAQLFTVSARSADGTIEAFEWGDATLGGKPFLLGVQWHPERMAFDMPMSGSIAQHFVHEADAFRSLIRPR
jgi:gamma-glutamyl-gamma-aminobutyrate hydrolase PuuD